MRGDEKLTDRHESDPPDNNDKSVYESSTGLVVLEEQQLWDIIKLQIERYHHLQRISRGLFGTLVALLTIFVSAYAAFSNRIGRIPTEQEALRPVAESLPVGVIAVNFTLILNLFIFIGLSILTAFSLLIASIRLFDAFTTRELSPKNLLKGNTIVSDEDYISVIKEIGENTPPNLQSIIEENQDSLNHTYRQFIEGAVRVLTFLALLFSTVFIYYYSSELNLGILFWYNIILATPGPIMNRVSVKLSNWGRISDSEDSSEQERPNIVREIMREKGRLSNIEFYPIEDQFMSGVSTLSSLVVLIWLSSIIYQLITYAI